MTAGPRINANLHGQQMQSVSPREREKNDRSDIRDINDPGIFRKERQIERFMVAWKYGSTAYFYSLRTLMAGVI